MKEHSFAPTRTNPETTGMLLQDLRAFGLEWWAKERKEGSVRISEAWGGTT